MRLPSILLAGGCLMLVAACATQQAEPVASAPATVAPKPAEHVAPPPISEEELETYTPRIHPLPRQPVPHPVAVERPHPVEPAAAAPASHVAAVVPAPLPKPAAQSATKASASSAARSMPVWFAGCQRVQRQGSALMCDTDNLLAPPSENVRVYVREPRLVRKYDGGFFTELRESLPRLYRIFVMQ